jgi:hypothetical protein
LGKNKNVLDPLREVPDFGSWLHAKP